MEKSYFLALVHINKQNKDMSTWKETTARDIANLKASEIHFESEIETLKKENIELREKMLI